MTAAFFERDSGDALPFVVGRIRDEEMEILRVARGRGRPRLLALGSVSWESGTALGNPLERVLGWRPEESLVVAVATPLLAGASVTLRWPQEAQVIGNTTPQERALRAEWHAQEILREQSAQFFECSLEEVELLTTDLSTIPQDGAGQRMDITVTGLFQYPGAHVPSVPQPPPDVPLCHFVLLPVLLSELLHEERPARPRADVSAHDADAPEGLTPRSSGTRRGLFLVEEKTITVVLRRGSILERVRTLPLGVHILIEHVQRALGCSPREAEQVLEQMEGGALAAESTRMVARLLRELAPLFRAGTQLLLEGMKGDAQTRFQVAGRWPLLLHRFFFGSLAAVRGFESSTSFVLARPVFSPIRPDRSSAPLPSLLLLEHMAAALLLHTGEPASASLPPTVVTRGAPSGLR